MASLGRIACALVLAGLGGAAVAPSRAAPAPSRAAPVAPCGEDVKKLCPNVPPGGGRVSACLKAHERELSEACKTHLAEVKNRMGALTAVCRSDIGKLCPDVGPGAGRLVKCLRAKQEALSPECKAALDKNPAP
jgi:hypothetical protein